MAAEDLAGLLDSVQRLLGATQPTDSPDAQPALRGTGTSPNGLITAVAALGGRIESVAVDPRGLRLDSQTLGEEVAAAVNAALDDLRAQAKLAPEAVDLAALHTELTQVRDESARQFTSFLESISATQERVTADRR
ncbi:YbaB/EbfC family nucleoid-associated protein [Dactylosporangium sp. NPDC049525]|uniref:YbaB/EbfC family nucleoid-associated protein n=1 Tax=Dactylosporangium sp. NPDC049525 TaxID=3154730 RepID=UPI00343B8A0C